MARDYLLNFGTAIKAAGATGTTTLPNMVDIAPNGNNGQNGLYVRVVVNCTAATGTGTVQYSCSLEASKEGTATISSGTWTQIAATPSDVVAYRATVASSVVTEGAVVMFLRIYAPAGTLSQVNYTIGGVVTPFSEDNYTKFRVKVTDAVTGATNPGATYSASIVSAVDGTLG
jgi:hypothetical protein